MSNFEDFTDSHQDKSIKHTTQDPSLMAQQTAPSDAKEESKILFNLVHCNDNNPGVSE